MATRAGPDIGALSSSAAPSEAGRPGSSSADPVATATARPSASNTRELATATRRPEWTSSPRATAGRPSAGSGRR